MTKITQDVAGHQIELLSCQVSESTSRNVDPDNLHLFTAATQRLSLEERTAVAEGETPLTLAVKAGLTHNVRTLLEHGASPHNTNGKKETPLLLGKDGGRMKSSLSESSNTSQLNPAIIEYHS